MGKFYTKGIILITASLFIGVGGFLYWASSDIDSGVYMKCHCCGPDEKHCVSLTFDDGPDEEMTPKVLDILKRYNLKATFFIIGSKAEKHPEIVSRIVNEGHLIGGHSWSHSSSFPLQSSAKIYDELSKCEELILQQTGKEMLFFRPPFGVTNPLIAKAVKKKDCINIGWSIRSFDTDASKDRKYILNRIVKQLHNGAIILLHDRCEKADELLQLLIMELIEKQYDIINIDEMLNVPPYRN